MIAGKRGPEFAGLGPLKFSRDGKHFAYSAARSVYKFLGGEHSDGVVMMDDQQIGSYTGERVTPGFVGLFEPYLHGVAM